MRGLVMRGGGGGGGGEGEKDAIDRKGRMESRGLLNDQLINRLMMSIRGRGVVVVVEEKKRGA